MRESHKLDAVVDYLDYLRSPGEAFYTWPAAPESPDGAITLTGIEYSERVQRFVDELYACGLIRTDFDWPGWQHEAVRYVAHPELLRSADMDICTRLLTVHVRKERFCDGHLGAVLDSGHMAAIVQRLAEIRDDTRQGGG